jgi:GTP-binding protein LepA
MELKNIRNFCIIAHIDHGKSTLADRILEITGAVDKRKLSAQMMDSMELEQERGITIKAKAVRLKTTVNGQEYILNLIDTPGHVDFSYEVAKSMKACEGAILLVDASQGVEAQTVANFHLAFEGNLHIIPVLNKIDLPGSNPERAIGQLEDVFGFKKEEVSFVSAKDGSGVAQLIERVIKEMPAPEGDENKPLRAILFDSMYDPYRGVILFIRIFDGKLKSGDEILFMHQKKRYKVEELGIFLPQQEKAATIGAGEVGYISCNMRDPNEVDMGDTITWPDNPTEKPFEGYKKLSPMVFSGIFPTQADDYPVLRQAVDKLKLSDPAFTFEPDNLGTLGHGFRCGFLGLLHMEIVQERLEREFGLDLILTSPNVKYKLINRNKEEVYIESPHQLPDPNMIEQVYEPFVRATVVVPPDGMESVCELSKGKRGIFIKMDYLGKDRLSVVFELPLSEILVDYYDKLKSITKGYASLDYEIIDYRPTEIVKLDLYFNKKQAEAFSLIVNKERMDIRARSIVEKLKELIPRQQFEVSIQAAIGGKIIAAEKVSALKKNVTSKCYGGDITRKRKLWEKQKEGKKKMKQMGNVDVPPDAFIEVLKM